MVMNFKSILLLCRSTMFVIIINAIYPFNAYTQRIDSVQQNPFYKIKLIYLPDQVRPEVKYSLDQLQMKKATGDLPTYDGEQFQVNLRDQKINNTDDAKRLTAQFLQSLRVPLTMDKEMRMKINATSAKANNDYIEQQIKQGRDKTEKKLTGTYNNVNKSSEKMLDEMAADTRKQAGLTVTTVSFNQYLNDIPIDQTAINITSRNETGLVSIHGKFYNTVNITNKKTLDAAAALSKAVAQIKSQNKYDKIEGDGKKAELVLLPYAEGFKYAWKEEIKAEGPYGVWIDAETGKVLQLLPHFRTSDNAKGLVFNPSPTQGTTEMSFEVDPASGGKYKLNLAGIITLTNDGGDGTSGIVEVNDDGSGTANFNQSPINGTVVEHTSLANYNGQFQQVNIYAHIFNERRIYLFLGSNAFPALSIVLNTAGNNSFCCAPHYFTGSTTLSSSAGTCTSPCNWDLATDCYNAGIDGTVIAHEFGHQLNEIQFDGGIGGFTMPTQLHEGMADYWACTNFNMNIFAGWWAHDCPSPTQSGMAPRQADASDAFPDRISDGCASYEGHSAGQIICWANWSAREGMNDATGWGTLTMNLNLIKGLTTATSTSTGTAKATRDSYVDLLKQLVPLYDSSRLIHKLLAGYARAGIFLSSKDAIIDIDHSYLDNHSATGPAFTIWTGEDYTFSGSSVVTTGTLPFNTQFMVEVANDVAFTSNLKTSGWLGGVTAGAGGTATWTLPVADWNVLKAGTDIYYRVTTKDGAGGNVRTSWQPGNNFLGINVPVGRAAINGTGTKDCSCSASAGSTQSAMGLIPVLPLLALAFYRKRKVKR